MFSFSIFSQKPKQTMVLSTSMNGSSFKNQSIVLEQGAKLTDCKFKNCHIIYSGGEIHSSSFKSCTSEKGLTISNPTTTPLQLKQLIQTQPQEKTNNISQSNSSLPTQKKTPIKKPKIFIETGKYNVDNEMYKMGLSVRHMEDRHYLTLPSGQEIRTASWKGDFKPLNGVIYSGAHTGIYCPNTKQWIDIIKLKEAEIDGIKFKYLPDIYDDKNYRNNFLEQNPHLKDIFNHIWG